jgi:hypothetical protein
MPKPTTLGEAVKLKKAADPHRAAKQVLLKAAARYIHSCRKNDAEMKKSASVGIASALELIKQFKETSKKKE